MKDVGEDGKLISPNKARRILGVLAKDLDDTQLIEIINSLRLLAKSQLSYNGSNYERKNNKS